MFLRLTYSSRKVSSTPVHDAQHLLPDVLSSLQRASLDKVLETPGVGELVVLPGVVDGQQCQVIPLELEELGLLLISQSLLVLETSIRWNHSCCWDCLIIFTAKKSAIWFMVIM